VTGEERDHVDDFLEEVAERLPDLDLEIEGILDRIGGLSRRIHRMFDDTLAELDLSHGEWKVLRTLDAAGPPHISSPGALAAKLELSSGAMTNRLDRLEEAGLVCRLPDPHDRRGIQVQLTVPGQERYRQAVAMQAAKEAIVGAALDPQEQKQLNALLRRVMIVFERDPRYGRPEPH
jgi:DNA-binding MarR family transcriptional regulator